MSNAETNYFFNQMEGLERRIMELERLAGVQGPEQALVGDVAKRIPRQEAVEDAEPGKRGGGEIAGAVELLRHVDKKIREARRLRDVSIGKGEGSTEIYYMGKTRALEELREYVEIRTGQRSDLSNVTEQQPAPTKTDES